MRTHTKNVVDDVKRQLQPRNKDQADIVEWEKSLQDGWNAWNYSQKRTDAQGIPEFWSHSFGLIALSVMFEAMEKLGAI
jgi:hypothetical protein